MNSPKQIVVRLIQVMRSGSQSRGWRNQECMRGSCAAVGPTLPVPPLLVSLALCRFTGFGPFIEFPDNHLDLFGFMVPAGQVRTVRFYLCFFQPLAQPLLCVCYLLCRIQKATGESDPLRSSIPECAETPVDFVRPPARRTILVALRGPAFAVAATPTGGFFLAR